MLDCTYLSLGQHSLFAALLPYLSFSQDSAYISSTAVAIQRRLLTKGWQALGLAAVGCHSGVASWPQVSGTAAGVSGWRLLECHKYMCVSNEHCSGTSSTGAGAGPRPTTTSTQPCSHVDHPYKHGSSRLGEQYPSMHSYPIDAAM